jgi:hypothetical protein
MISRNQRRVLHISISASLSDVSCIRVGHDYGLVAFLRPSGTPVNSTSLRSRPSYLLGRLFNLSRHCLLFFQLESDQPVLVRPYQAVLPNFVALSEFR